MFCVDLEVAFRFGAGAFKPSSSYTSATLAGRFARDAVELAVVPAEYVDSAGDDMVE